MPKWIEFTFGGFGVAIVLFILGLFLNRARKSKQTQRGGHGSTNVQAGRDINIGDRDG